MAIALLILLFSLSASPTAAKSCERNFHQAARNWKNPRKEIDLAISEVAGRLGFEPRIEIKHRSINMYNAQGRCFGSLDFSLLKKHFEIEDIDVDIEYRRKGVSEALVALALREHPEVEEMHTGSLLATNGGVMKETLAKGFSCKKAIMATPAYKMRVRFGFTRLVKFECTRGTFTVRRP